MLGRRRLTMASSILGQRGGNSILSAVQQLRALGNPNQAYAQLYQSNPQFRQFADSMRGKTPEQAFRENGLDFGQFRNIF